MPKVASSFLLLINILKAFSIFKILSTISGVRKVHRDQGKPNKLGGSQEKTGKVTDD